MCLVPAHRAGQQGVLERAQGGEYLVRVRRARQLDGALQDDRPAVDLSGLDEVDGDAEDLRAVGEGLLDRAHAGEGGKQRRVHVDDPAREAFEERVVEDRHVAGEDDERDLAFIEPVRDRSVPEARAA